MKTYTIVAYYPDTDEVVIDHCDGNDVREAAAAFWDDSESPARKTEICYILAAFEGVLNDELVGITGLEGAISYLTWQSIQQEYVMNLGEEYVKNLGPMAKAARRRNPKYHEMRPLEQWEEDRRLGILDWDGDPSK